MDYQSQLVERILGFGKRGTQESTNTDASTTDISNEGDEESEEEPERIKTEQYVKTIAREHQRKTEKFHFLRGESVTITYDYTEEVQVGDVTRTKYYKGVSELSFKTWHNPDGPWPQIKNVEISEGGELQEIVTEANVAYVTPVEEETVELQQDINAGTAYWSDAPEDAEGYLSERVGEPRIVTEDEMEEGSD